jgi:hypothetical protein
MSTKAARLLGFANPFDCCLIYFNVSPQVTGEHSEVAPTTGTPTLSDDSPTLREDAPTKVSIF